MKFICLLCAIAVSAFCVAATPADLGNLAVAMRASDAVERVGGLLYALENAPQAYPALLRALRGEIAGSKRDAALRMTAVRRLLAVWRLRPADVGCADLAMEQTLRSGSEVSESELLPLCAATLKSAELKKLDQDGRVCYFRILQWYLETLKRSHESPSAAGFMDTLVAKYPDEPQILAAAAWIYVYGCFLETDTAPDLPGWDALPGKNVWKKRMELLRKYGSRAVVRNRYDALSLSTLSIYIYDRKLMLESLDIRREVPVSDQDAPGIEVLASTFKMPELTSSNGGMADFFVMVNCGKVAEAEAMLPELDEKIRPLAELYLLERKRDWRAIQKLAAGKNFSFSSIPELLFVFGAAGRLQDAEMLGKLLAQIGELGSGAPPLSAKLYNTAAYACAMAGAHLDTGLQLVDKALALEPQNSSYADTRAWLLFRQGKYAQARSEIGNALKHRNAHFSTATIFYHAAAIELAATGDKKSARLYFERAEKLRVPELDDPADEEIEKLRESLR